jgi:hypothetical protein
MSTEITMYQGPPTLSIEQAIMVWLDEKHHRSESHKTQHAYRNTLHAFRDALQSAGLDLDWAGDIGKRLERHSRCEGARLLEVVRAAGISWQLVRTWPDADRSVESMLKRRHSGVRLCPICQHKAGRRKPMGKVARLTSIVRKHLRRILIVPGAWLSAG